MKIGIIGAMDEEIYILKEKMQLEKNFPLQEWIFIKEN